MCIVTLSDEDQREFDMIVDELNQEYADTQTTEIIAEKHAMQSQLLNSGLSLALKETEI